MPNRFKQSGIDVTAEDASDGEVRVLKLDTPASPEIKAFQFDNLKHSHRGDYAKVKAKFGALAATDTDRGVRNQRDRRFSLNPLLRDPLSVEEEERRVIDEKVKTRVEALAGEARTRAAEVGYQDGLKKGHDEAFLKFQQEGAERVARFEELLAGMEGARDKIFQANERFLMEMVFRIARMITLKELSTDSEYVLRLARGLLERVGVRENISIRISTEEIATAGMIKEGLEKSLGAMKNLEIEISNQVKRGGCMIETEWNAIDASIETQLKAVYEGLTGSGGTRT